MDPRGTASEKFHIASFYHHAIRYLVIRQDRKKSSYFPACVKAEWNKNCANSIRSRLRNEMEDSNSNEAKQANVAVSSLNYFAVKYYLPKMTLMRQWFQNVVSLILTSVLLPLYDCSVHRCFDQWRHCNSDTWLLPHTGKNTLQAIHRDAL